MQRSLEQGLARSKRSVDATGYNWGWGGVQDIYL